MIPGLGRSPGEGKGYPLQYSGLENSMDCIHGVAKSWTQVSNIHSLDELTPLLLYNNFIYIVFSLKSIFSDTSKATFTLFCFLFAWTIFSASLYFKPMSELTAESEDLAGSL